MRLVFNRKIIFILILVAIATTVSALAWIYQSPNSDTIRVIVPLKGNIQAYKLVLVQGRCTPAKYLGFTDDRGLEHDVIIWAENNGMEAHERDLYRDGTRAPDMLISTEARIVRGLPYLNRHFGIEYWHYGHIKIRFVDPHSNEIIGEVHYDRPFLKYAPSNIYKLMLDRITQKRYGLTDFSKWERRQFEKSKIAMDLPVGFYGYHDRAVTKESEWYTNVLTLHFHDIKLDNDVFSGLGIYFEEMTPDKFSRMREEARATPNKEMVDYVHWFSDFHDDVAKRDEFAANGPYTKYIKDYRNRKGRMIRAEAVLNNKLRPEGPAIDDQAIIRMLKSVDVQ
jgi:hypothetical protein